MMLIHTGVDVVTWAPRSMYEDDLIECHGHGALESGAWKDVKQSLASDRVPIAFSKS